MSLDRSQALCSDVMQCRICCIRWWLSAVFGNTYFTFYLQKKIQKLRFLLCRNRMAKTVKTLGLPVSEWLGLSFWLFRTRNRRSDEHKKWVLFETKIKNKIWFSHFHLAVYQIAMLTQHIHCESKNWATFIFTVTSANVDRFLADRTNGRAYATALRLSVDVDVIVICDVMYYG